MELVYPVSCEVLMADGFVDFARRRLAAVSLVTDVTSSALELPSTLSAVKLMPLFSVCWISVGCFKPPSVHSRICKDVQMNVRIRRCMWWRTPFGAEWFIVTVFSRTRVNATRNHSRMVNVHIFTTVAKWTLVFAEQSVFVAVLRTRDDESNGPCRDSVFIPAHYRIF
ncbi:hypothetical protein Q8A73_007204 [Channa argus]|nr:hypothetical protein Q8A73_007204 [Channa argus]